MGTTNILDLNNRLTKVEKENVAQNSYNSLKNKPKINNITLTGNKSLADIGAATAADLTKLANDLTNLITLTNVTITPQSTGVEYIFIDKPQSKSYSAIFLECASPSGSSNDYLDLWVQAVNASATQAVIRYKATTANLNYNVSVMWL